MRTRTGITLQDAHELQRFVEHLESGQLATAELKNVLIILRQYSDSGILWEWANSVAHKRRDKGGTFQAGTNLWLERFQIYAYFSGEPDLKRIPASIFETLVYWIENDDWGVDGVFLKEIYPTGQDKKQAAASLKYMYRKLHQGNVYELIPGDKNDEDLLLIEKVLPRLERTNWGEPPFAFKKVVAEIAAELQRLIKVSKRKITKHKDFIALHFLCAFHQTEIALKNFKDHKTHCYLSVDSREEKLCLSLALYQFEDGSWKQLEIADGTYNRRTGVINYCHSRPFLITGLSERKYCPKTRCDLLFEHAVEVKSGWIRKYIGRV